MLHSLWNLLTPMNLLLLFVAAMSGMVLGAIPGLSGITGLAILLPFAYSMEPTTAMVLMVGLTATVSAGDTLPAVLWGVPGTAGSQTTLLDGYALAKKGQAVRALSAAYFSSAFGGLFGALCLLLSLPLVKYLFLAFGSPELLMISVLGLSMISALAGRSLMVGLTLGCLGLMTSMVGQDPQSGVYRWTFGLPYLLEGLPLVPVTLGLFGVPEMADLFARGKYLAGNHQLKADWRVIVQGFRDMVSNWALVVRNALLGAYVGILPGVGAPVADWLAYGYTVQNSPNKENFGKGDIRGVIGPESANNARLGGDLIPTLIFGVPGSLSMVFLLAALTSLGLTPSPRLLAQHPELFYTVIWTLVLANIMACIVGLSTLSQAAKICLIPVPFLVVTITVAMGIAALQTTWNMGDLVLMLIFSLVGWVWRRCDWPRSAFVLGLILGPIIGQRLQIANDAYGWTWIYRPGVIVITLIMLASIYFGSRRPAPKVDLEQIKAEAAH